MIIDDEEVRSRFWDLWHEWRYTEDKAREKWILEILTFLYGQNEKLREKLGETEKRLAALEKSSWQINTFSSGGPAVVITDFRQLISEKVSDE